MALAFLGTVAGAGGLVTGKQYKKMAPLEDPRFLSAQGFLAHTDGTAWTFFSKLHPGGVFYVDASTRLVHLQDDDDECLTGKVIEKSSIQFFVEWDDDTRELYEAVILSENRLRLLPIDQKTNAQLDYFQTDADPGNVFRQCPGYVPIS